VLAVLVLPQLMRKVRPIAPVRGHA
jgi:hypothetical protein